MSLQKLVMDDGRDIVSDDCYKEGGRRKAEEESY